MHGFGCDKPTYEQIKSCIDAGMPMAISHKLYPNAKEGHSVVVVGYADGNGNGERGLIIHDPSEGEYKKASKTIMSYDEYKDLIKDCLIFEKEF